MKKLIYIMFACMLLSCSPYLKKTQFVPVSHENVQCEPAEITSQKDDKKLWQQSSRLNRLFIDSSARQVNDIVTVSIIETSSASRSASTKTGRNSSVSASISDFLGAPANLGLRGTNMAEGSLKNAFDGSGETKRSSQLIATITARVIEVLPNGNLVIKGKRNVKVNNETQYIILTGIIRPDDISSNNVVLSTSIADARVEYGGTGIISDKQKPGWAIRIIDLVWPF